MKTNSNNKGLVLVGVLWIVIVLTAIVAVLGRKSRMDSKLVLARSETIRTKWACRAGIERAIAVLNEDEKDTDGYNDIWAYDTEDFNDFQMAGCYYNVIVSDESAKLNINTATFDQLMGLPNMYEDIADAIIDWRDSDEDVSPLGTEGGYYENLTFGYPNRNAPFRTIRELLLVKGVTDDLFYGEDTNLNGNLDYNEMDGDLNPPADNGDSWLDTGWAAYITCYTDTTAADATSTTTTTTDPNQSTSLLGLNTEDSPIIFAASNQNTSSSGLLTAAVNTSSTTTLYATGGGGGGGGGAGGGQNTQQQTQTTQQQTQTTQQQTTTTTTTQQQTQTTQQQTTTTTTTQQQTQTTSSGGLININTASATVLAALLGGSNEAYAVANAIIGYRENLQYGIEDPSELVDAGILTSDELTAIQDYVTITSNIFKITCTATAYRGNNVGTTLRTEVVIDRSTSPCKVLYWYQGASN